MDTVAWLLIGGSVGWLAHAFMNTDGQSGLLLNMIIGVVGAFLGGSLLGKLLGTATINDGAFSPGGLGLSLLGAIVLLWLVKYLRRGATS